MDGRSKVPYGPLYTSGNSNHEDREDATDTLSQNKQDKPKTDYKEIKQISSGEYVNVRRFLEPGMFTVFMFHADWCSPCRKIKPRVEASAMSSNSLALREIDITDP